MENYKKDTTIRRFIQKSAAIAFVLLNFVRVSWNGLKAEMPDDEKLERHTAYFDETWFGGHLDNELARDIDSYISAIRHHVVSFDL